MPDETSPMLSINEADRLAQRFGDDFAGRVGSDTDIVAWLGTHAPGNPNVRARRFGWPHEPTKFLVYAFEKLAQQHRFEAISLNAIMTVAKLAPHHRIERPVLFIVRGADESREHLLSRARSAFLPHLVCKALAAQLEANDDPELAVRSADKHAAITALDAERAECVEDADAVMNSYAHRARDLVRAADLDGAVLLAVMTNAWIGAGIPVAEDDTIRHGWPEYASRPGDRETSRGMIALENAVHHLSTDSNASGPAATAVRAIFEDGELQSLDRAAQALSEQLKVLQTTRYELESELREARRRAAAATAEERATEMGTDAVLASLDPSYTKRGTALERVLRIFPAPTAGRALD